MKIPKLYFSRNSTLAINGNSIPATSGNLNLKTCRNSIPAASGNSARTTDEKGKREEGSAILEFLIFALPLFIPLAMFLQNVNQSSQLQFDTNNYARQLARAYVTSPSADYLDARLNAVTQTFMARVFSKDSVTSIPNVSVQCASTPCLRPGSAIELSVIVKADNSQSVSRTSVKAYVDAWR